MKIEFAQTVPPKSKIVTGASKIVLGAQSPSKFRGRKIENTGDAKGLFITKLRVNDKPQFPETNPISMSCFMPGVLDNDFIMDSCDATGAITVEIENMSDEPRNFAMSLSD